MESVEIRLLEPEMLGRRFQYAFLSFSDKVRVRPEQDLAVFPTVEDFVAAVQLAYDAIREALRWDDSRRRRKCPPEAVLARHGLDCCQLDRGPSLYQAGKKSDFRTLVQAGLDSCKYVTSSGKLSVAWTHAAISYALRVLENNGPLEDEGEYDILWLARASLFTRIRGISGTSIAKEKKIDVNTLGTILLGGALAYLGTYRLADQQVEFYVLPEYVSRAYRVLRQIAAMDGIGRNLAAKTVRLANELSIGFEQALDLAVASTVLRHFDETKRAGVRIDEALGSGKLYTVQPGRRAQVRAGIPLPNILQNSYSESTITSLDIFVNTALAQRNNEASKSAKNAASSCINSMFLQALAGAGGDLYIRDCMRDLLSLVNYDKAPASLRQSASILLRVLESEARSILERAQRS